MKPGKSILIVLTLLVSISNVNAQDQSTPSTDNSALIKQQIESILNQTTSNDSLYKSTKLLTIEVQTPKTDYNALVKGYNSLVEKINNLYSRDSVNRVVDSILIFKKYTIGALALDQIKKGVTVINFSQMSMALEQTIDQLTNLWSDTVFRTFWDNVQDWGTIAGGILGAGSLALHNENTKNIGLISGLSLMSVAAVLGKYLGVNNEEASYKYNFFDLSRQSYDNLIVRQKKLEGYIRQNDSFLQRLNKFERLYLNARNVVNSLQSDTLKFYTSLVVEYLSEYKYILSEIPAYLDDIESTMATYSYKFSSEPKLKAIFDKVKLQIYILRTKYSTDVRPIIDVSDYIKSVIYLN
jgi:hypothetical protein